MKLSKDTILIIVAWLMAFSLTSCGSSPQRDNDSSVTTVDDTNTTVNTTDNRNINASAFAVLDAYLGIKDALVKDDQETAARFGAVLAQQASDVDVSGHGQGNQQQLRDIFDRARQHGEQIAESDIARQREHFEPMGADIKNMVEIAGTDRTLYHQYCPMYNNNKGGMWLSESSEIKNPLFGSKMLTCGSVQDTLVR
jgi:hypothetical protein